VNEAPWALRLAEAVVGAARAIGRRVPRSVRRSVEDRVFYVIFQRTRVENDAYGWRPSTPPGPGRAAERQGSPPTG
jgi:hypothetical protein